MKTSWLALAASVAVLTGVLAQGEARSVPPESVNLPLITGDKLPRTLRDFAFFADPAARHLNNGVVPYKLNTPLYSDGADKLRYIFVPSNQKVSADGDGLLQFPIGTAIIKTFAFGEGEDERFIETRVLLHRADGWLALPYKWNAEQTTATLALAGGRLLITRPDGSEISYRIPNKNQCKTCHNKDGEVIPIGPKLRNLSAEDLASLGIAARSADALPQWSRRNDAAMTAKVARAYLDVNCAHCHQPGGSASNSGLDLRWEQDDPHAIGIRKPPVAAGRGAGGHQVSIAPGEPDKSILLYRMKSVEPGVAMPELSRGTVDEDGVEAIRKWIEGMPAS